MKTYLVEAYSEKVKFEENSNIISLTPEACYQLDKADIKYSILEDYYDEADFLKEEEAYFKNQLAWFDKFDNFLFSIFPEARIKDLRLATSYYFYIKNMVDSLILRCKIINIFLNKVKPNSIIFISTSWKEDLISSAEYPLLFRKGQSLFSRLMPLFCKKYNIDFQRIILKETAGSGNIYAGCGNFTNRIKNGLKANKYVRHLWYFYKTFNISDIFPKSFKNHKYNMLFLKTPGFVKDIMKELQKDGHQVFYKRGKDIIKQSSVYHKVLGSIYGYGIPKLGKNIDGISNELNSIIEWINSYCGIDVTPTILPRLFYIINEFCPQLIYLIDKYITFYNDHQIDLVFTPHMVTVDEYAAIIATRYTEKTKSACLQHGDDAFALKIWDVGEYSPYHIYFTTNYEREEYIKHRIELGNFNTKVFQYPNRYKMLPKLNRVRSNNERQKKTMVFVPTMYQWDNTFWDESRVPNTWYFSWHKKLINYFSSRDNFNFIWKGIPASNEIYDPIPNIIKDRKYKNIKYATEPFVKWVKKADIVLLDYPSTALYEAAVSGLPVMSLYFTPFNVIRGSALKLFGKSLQPFNNFDEGIARIENFLKSNIDEFIVSIPRSEISIIETLDCLTFING